MYYVSAAAGIAPIHVDYFWDLSTMCFVSLFCLVCQLHILVALQWNKTRLHAVFLFRFHYFRSIIFLYAKLSFFQHFFLLLIFWSLSYFFYDRTNFLRLNSPYTMIDYRFGVLCVFHKSDALYLHSPPTTTSKTDSFSFLCQQFSTMLSKSANLSHWMLSYFRLMNCCML